jgi:hypothetical protein
MPVSYLEGRGMLLMNARRSYTKRGKVLLGRLLRRQVAKQVGPAPPSSSAPLGHRSKLA